MLPRVCRCRFLPGTASVDGAIRKGAGKKTWHVRNDDGRQSGRQPRTRRITAVAAGGRGRCVGGAGQRCAGHAGDTACHGSGASVEAVDEEGIRLERTDVDTGTDVARIAWTALVVVATADARVERKAAGERGHRRRRTAVAAERAE